MLYEDMEFLKGIIMFIMFLGVYKHCHFPILLPIALRRTPFETIKSTG